VKILALYNIKGGVGKTAGAVNLSYYAALAGYRTLVWDLDPQGAATFYFRIRPKVKGGGKKLLAKKNRLQKAIRASDFEGLDVVPADFSYRHLDLLLDAAEEPEKRFARLLATLADEYDLVFLDCAPSISRTSESVFAASDVLLIPTIPTPLSIRALEQIDGYLFRKGPEGLCARPFLSMVDRRKKLHRRGEELLAESGVELRRTGAFLDAQIPYSSHVEQMGIQRAPLPSFAYHSRASRAYLDLWREIETLLRLGTPLRWQPIL
jgi:cellulose biosynthesis protein BcsQ